MTIGERAAQAITEHAKQKGVSDRWEMISLGVNHSSFNKWKRGEGSPSAYFLQQMLYAGYDVIWILGGEENGQA